MPPFVRKLHHLSFKEWVSTYGKVAGIVSVCFIAMFGFDYATIRVVPRLMSLVATQNAHLPKLWLTLFIITGVILALSIFLQEGTKEGLTSMFGSTVQYGDITGGFKKNIATATNVGILLLFVELLIAPFFLGGSL